MKSMKFVFVIPLLLLFICGGLRTQTVEKTSINNTMFQIRCDGVIKDILRGTIITNFLTHYKDGKVDWYKQDMEDVILTSIKTGELFDISFHQKQDGIGLYENIVIVTIHYNCVGDMGSHYMISEIIQSDFTNVVPPNQPVNTYLKQECKCW